jgi:hypothetical protein
MVGWIWKLSEKETSNKEQKQALLLLLLFGFKAQLAMDGSSYGFFAACTLQQREKSDNKKGRQALSTGRVHNVVINQHNISQKSRNSVWERLF